MVAPMGTAKQSFAFCPSFRDWIPGHTRRIHASVVGCRPRELQSESFPSRISPMGRPSRHQSGWAAQEQWGLRWSLARQNGKIHYLRHAGQEHVLCYAPTRSGKGVGLILPTLLSWQQSVFVTDLKGELYELTSGWRQKYAHNRILRFEPAAAAGSCCFNPMAELRLGTEHEVGDVQNLALLIVDPDGRGLKSGDHFQKTAYSLLVGCILHLCYKAKVEGTPATFGAL